MAASTARAALYDCLPLHAPQVRAWADELWADWEREADDPDRDLILDELARTWTQQIRDLDEDGRVDALHRAVVERRVRALSRDSLHLATASLGLVADLPPDQARTRAESLAEQVMPLANAIRALPPHPVVDLLERDLRVAALELVHAAQGGAMSPRLARIAHDAGLESA